MGKAFVLSRFRFYECMCGETKAFSTMGVPLCVTCDECRSTLALGPEEYQVPEPHDWESHVDQTTGEAYYFCTKCLRRSAFAWREGQA